MEIKGEKNGVNYNNILKSEIKHAQFYHIARKSENLVGAVGRPLVHMSAFQQTTGYSS